MALSWDLDFAVAVARYSWQRGGTCSRSNSVAHCREFGTSRIASNSELAAHCSGEVAARANWVPAGSGYQPVGVFVRVRGLKVRAKVQGPTPGACSLWWNIFCVGWYPTQGVRSLKPRAPLGAFLVLSGLSTSQFSPDIPDA